MSGTVMHLVLDAHMRYVASISPHGVSHILIRGVSRLDTRYGPRGRRADCGPGPDARDA